MLNLERFKEIGEKNKIQRYNPGIKTQGISLSDLFLEIRIDKRTKNKSK